jgi:hypothetical protein
MSTWIKNRLEAPNGLKIITGSWEPLHHKEQLAWMVAEPQVIINVADSACFTFELSSKGKPNYWFPILEYARWPVSNLFGVKRVLDFCSIHPGVTVFVHCHGGLVRSKAVVAIWLMERFKLSIQEAEQLTKMDEGQLGQLFTNGRVTKYDLDLLRASGTRSINSLLTATHLVDKPCTELRDNL